MSGCNSSASVCPTVAALPGAIDYSPNHWAALTANLRDGNVPVANNHCENQMRPWAVGRKSWLFAGSELAGQRAAVVMSLVVSAKLNRHDPWAWDWYCSLCGAKELIRRRVAP